LMNEPDKLNFSPSTVDKRFFNPKIKTSRARTKSRT
jgi:hypothetical protein